MKNSNLVIRVGLLILLVLFITGCGSDYKEPKTKKQKKWAAVLLSSWVKRFSSRGAVGLGGTFGLDNSSLVVSILNAPI